MNTCLSCDKPTKNPKFCNRSCSASYNNRLAPKRPKTKKCKGCDTLIDRRRVWCTPECNRFTKAKLAKAAREEKAKERAAEKELALSSAGSESEAPPATTPLAPRKHPKTVGDACELEFLYRLSKAGIPVAVPFIGENTRYDMIVEDIDGRLYKVQCKSGRLRNGVVAFATSSSYYHHPNSAVKNTKRGYRGEVDLFGVYCPDNEKLYFISPDAVPEGGATLRVDPPANNQTSYVKWAEDFEWKPGVKLSDLETKR